jgi:type I restriction enzyme S subunit
MNADTLLENFEILAEAPGGIDRLRELILKMAVSGKLVEQSQGDGDAGELVPKYVANQKLMTDDGVIGTQRFQRGSNSPQLPYHIPKNWRWHYLGDVGAIIGGGTPSSSVSSYWSDHDAVPWLTPADMRKLSSRYVMRGRRDITPKGLTESSAQLLPRGAVLFSSRAPIGHVAIAAQPLATNQGFKSCVPYIAEMKEYIYFFLLQIGPQVDANATGTTFKEVSGKQVAQILIPVPPLAEQRRIVAKVDELMALCDQLEQQQKHRNNLRTAIRKSAIDAISTATTPEELEAAWNRINNNWDVIVDTPESIDAMRKLILDLYTTPRIDQGDFVLKLGQVVQVLNGDRSANYPSKEQRVESGIPFINAGHLQNGDIDMSEMDFITPEKFQSLKGGKVQDGDILFCLRGSLGKCAIVRDIKEGTVASSLAILRPNEQVNSRYLLRFLQSGSCSRQIKKFDNGSAQPNLAAKSILNFELFLPALSAQNQVVKKIDELMALCDQLEARLKVRSEVAEKFARSVVSAA